MAKEDYNVADRDLGNGVTAAEVLSESGRGDSPDAESRTRAYEAGVSHPAYVDYAAALATHEQREDIEPLAARRAREYGDSFDDAEFMRLVPGQPGPGSVGGLAPKQAGAAGLDPANADVYDLDSDNDNNPATPEPTP